MKAISRREENVKLQKELTEKNIHLANLSNQNKDLKKELEDVVKRMAKLEEEREFLKKKPSNKR